MYIKDINWKEWHKTEDDYLIGFKFNNGSKISILDRQTGYGYDVRDIETGYKDKNNKFWLASGNFDIRQFENITVDDAIQIIKENANTCIGI